MHKLSTAEKFSITIAIVTYERMDYLSAALESACKQDVMPEEILIIDDGSTADISSLVKGFQDRFSGLIRYVWQENAGRPAARNRAVQECRTTHLLWLDDDDCLTPNAVSSYRTLLSERPDADIIYGRLTLCNERLEPLEPMPCHEFDESNMLYLFFKHNPIPNPGTLISLNCFKQVGQYDSAFPRSQDYDFYTRAASLGAKFLHNPTEVCLYRSHSGNLALSTEQRKAAKYRALVVQNFIARHDIEDIFPQLEWKAKPEKSLEAACWEMACLFARLGAFDCSTDALNCSLEVTPCETASFALTLIKDVFEGELANFSKYKKDIKLYGPRISTLINCALEFLCSLEEGDAYKLDLLETRGKHFSLEEVYTSLPWDKNRPACNSAAIADIIHNSTILGGFDFVFETYRLLGMEKQAVCSFIMDIFFRFQRGGLENIEALKSNSLITQPAVKNVLAALEIRARRYSQHKVNKTTKSAGKITIPIDEIISRSTPILSEAARGFAGNKIAANQEALRPRQNLRTILAPDIAQQQIHISVIIPTFNRPTLLRTAIESVINQAGGPYELIVVNDAGTAVEESLLAELKQANIAVHIVEHTQNLGLGAARNTGISLASGEFVLFLDDDDSLAPGALYLLCEQTRLKDVDFVYGDHIRQFYQDGRKSTQEYRKAIHPKDNPLVYENQIICGTFILRRSIAISCGGYREDLMVHEDYNFHLRIWKGLRVATVSVPVLIYNIFDSTERMNNARRAYWFATSALNHAIYNELFQSSDKQMKEQRVIQYRQLAKLPSEAYRNEELAQLINVWWQQLAHCGLGQHLALDKMIMERELSAPLPFLEQAEQTGVLAPIEIVEIDRSKEDIASRFANSFELLRKDGFIIQTKLK
jgi:glycosyltransferase involved in cell wall biosynthesis